MVIDENVAAEAADHLLQINAIKLNSKNPFVWASGWHSPIYCDNRLVLSYPPVRNYFRTQIAKFIEQTYGKPDAIAGVATGAIGIGILVAEYLGLPFVYVRPEPKAHGRKNQIEGYIEKGQSAIVIEDLISTGKSSMLAVEALRNSGVVVKGMVALFTYDFEASKKLFEKERVDLHTVSSYDFLLKEALQKKYINEEELLLLKQWRLSPETWKSA
ncbi:MAG: orotate phosphoribosyltransferase [Flavobacteriaceae bacterium]|nr:orotate phosphoribosyltransferase [Flavobacteriaceae bacterium]